MCTSYQSTTGNILACTTCTAVAVQTVEFITLAVFEQESYQITCLNLNNFHTLQLPYAVGNKVLWQLVFNPGIDGSGY